MLQQHWQNQWQKLLALHQFHIHALKIFLFRYEILHYGILDGFYRTYFPPRFSIYCRGIFIPFFIPLAIPGTFARSSELGNIPTRLFFTIDK